MLQMREQRTRSYRVFEGESPWLTTQEERAVDRRDFLKGSAASSGIGVLAAAGLMPAGAALGAHHEAGEAASTPSAAALAELRDTVAAVEASFSDPAWRIQDPADMVDARRILLHSLQHGLEVFVEGDEVRPNFKRFVTPEKKLLGDNPDAVYFHSLIDPNYSYLIRGNIADATYTSFTVEMGTGEGGNSTGVGATLNDTEFEINSDGSYEIIASPEKQSGNWLKLPKGAGSLSTRHYYERKISVADDRLHHIPLVIEPFKWVPAPDRVDEELLAKRIRRVARFIRESVVPPQPPDKSPQWVSTLPNQLPAPKLQGNENASTGFAAVDNVYSMAPFLVKPCEALVIRGRFPKCRFSNVVLWNRFIQTLDYDHRTVSLNRKQTKLESDGSFKMVVAAEDPGVPNWLDSGGRALGMMFWRFLLPEEEIEPLKTKLVPIGDVAQA